MTQLDDLQAYTNFEMPRRSAFLTVAITGYDGNPNGGGAPAILQGAPVGSWYLRETPLVTTYRKLTVGASGWVADTAIGQQLKGGPFTIYVDPTGGDDTSDGFTTGTAIKTLNEARVRTPLIPLDVLVFLMTGNHELPDFQTTKSNDRCRFIAGSSGLVIQGSVTDILTVSVTGAVENVVSVSDNLVAGAHVGQWIDAPIGATIFAKRVISNTGGLGTSTLTFAWTTATWGGFLTVPSSGTITLRDHDAHIVPNTVNETASRNGFYYSGPVKFVDVHWDGNGNGGATGPRTSDPLGYSVDTKGEIFWNCKFDNGLNAGALNSLSATFDRGCWFDGGNSGCEGGFVTGDTVFKDLTTAIRGSSILGAGNVQWNLGNSIFIGNQEGETTTDFSTRVWTAVGTFTPANHVQLGGFARYFKRNAPIIGLGTASYAEVFRVMVGGSNELDLFDSTSTIIGATNAYIQIDAIGAFPLLVISQTDWNDVTIYDRLLTKEPGQLVFN